MKIAIASWAGRRYAGTENYLAEIIPLLYQAGHSLALICERDVPIERDPIRLPPGAPRWCADVDGEGEALAGLRAWGPDLIYAHGALGESFELELLKIAPAVYFSHNYFGTCISGLKTFQFPVTVPCQRRFGWQCLAYYLPRRCGGLNPITMVQLYRREAKRLKRLRRYQMIVTHSEHMRAEYIRHGFPPSRVFSYLEAMGGQDVALVRIAPAAERRKGPFRLVFVGRLDRLKGCAVFLEALPVADQRLGTGLEVTIAGDGPDRPFLERLARRIATDRLRIQFRGWLGTGDLETVLKNSDLIVAPSLWPEPFGKVGPEAGQHGLPAAAFRVGGIPEWLVDGVNGHLAPGDPPTLDGLAVAIVQCLEDPGHHALLRANAAPIAERFAIERHCDWLLRLFTSVCPAGPVAAIGL